MAEGTTVKSLMFDIRANVSNAVNRKMTGVDNQLRQLTEDTQILRNSFLFLSFGLLAAGGMMTRFGKQLQGLADASRDAFARVDWASSIVSTTMTGTNEVIGEVRAEMMRLGRDTQFTAAQAGEAMQRLALAGFNMNETIGSTEAVLRLATLGLTDATTAADLAVGVFRGFDFEVENAAQATEVMAGIVGELAFAATHSATTVEELGEALKFVAAAADLVGFSLESITVALMVGADNMVRAGIAGRALRRSIVQIATLTEKAKGETITGVSAMQKYNIELTNQQGEIKDLIDIVEELQQKLGGLAATERTAAISAIFGTRAVTLWSAMMDESIDDLRARELELKIAFAKEALYENKIFDATEQLKKWRTEVKEGENFLKFFTQELGFNIETASILNDVLTDNTVTQERWNRAIDETAHASAITAERLETLQGTIILLQSSIDTMWASIGAELAPILESFNTLMKQIADRIEQLPGPIKLVVGVLILFGAIVFTIIGKIVTLAGSTMMLVAALFMLRKEKHKNMAADGLLLTGMKIIKLETMSLMKTTWGLVRAKAALAAKVMLAIGIFYLFAESADNTGNQMWLLVGVIAELVLWYGIMNKEKMRSILLSAWIYAAMIKTKAITIALTIARSLQAIATWAVTAAQWALNAAFWASPLGMIIGLVMVLVGVFIILAKHIGKVVEFFQWLWDVIVGFFEAIGDALGWFADLIGGLLGRSVIPDYFARGVGEIGESLSELEDNAIGTMERVKGGLQATVRSEVTAGSLGSGRGRNVAIINNSFGDVSVGGGRLDAEAFGDIVEESSTRALRKAEFELSSGKEGGA